MASASRHFSRNRSSAVASTGPDRRIDRLGVIGAGERRVDIVRPPSGVKPRRLGSGTSSASARRAPAAPRRRSEQPRAVVGGRHYSIGSRACSTMAPATRRGRGIARAPAKGRRARPRMAPRKPSSRCSARSRPTTSPSRRASAPRATATTSTMASVAEHGPAPEALHCAPDNGARRLPRVPGLCAARLVARGRPVDARRRSGRPHRLLRAARRVLLLFASLYWIAGREIRHVRIALQSEMVSMLAKYIREGLDSGRARGSPRRHGITAHATCLGRSARGGLSSVAVVLVLRSLRRGGLGCAALASSPSLSSSPCSAPEHLPAAVAALLKPFGASELPPLLARPCSGGSPTTRSPGLRRLSILFLIARWAATSTTAPSRTWAESARSGHRAVLRRLAPSGLGGRGFPVLLCCCDDQGVASRHGAQPHRDHGGEAALLLGCALTSLSRTVKITGIHNFRPRRS